VSFKTTVWKCEKRESNGLKFHKRITTNMSQSVWDATKLCQILPASMLSGASKSDLTPFLRLTKMPIDACVSENANPTWGKPCFTTGSITRLTTFNNFFAALHYLTRKRYAKRFERLQCVVYQNWLSSIRILGQNKRFNQPTTIGWPSGRSRKT